MIYLLYGITILLIVCGLINKNSKIIYILQMLWIWILIAFNTGGMDWVVHEQIFEASFNISYKITFEEIINGGMFYNYICKFFSILGYDFFIVNLFLSTIEIFILHKIITKNTKNRCIVLSLFIVYPLVETIIQKRNFAASICILMGMNFLLQDRKGNILKYIICCLIAAQFHVVAYIYILFAFLYKIDIKKLEKLIPIVCIVGYILIPVLPRLAAFIFPASKVQLYFYDLRLGIIDTVCWTILHILFVYLLKRFRNQAMKENKEEVKFTDKVYKINLISLIFLPLYYYEPTFIRIFRNLLILDYIVISYYFPTGSFIKKKVFENILLYISFLIMVFLLVYVITGRGFYVLVEPLFYNNLIFNYLIGG